MSATFDVGTAIERFGTTQPSPRDLAIHCGFTDEQADLLAMFWDPAFNGGWLYLSDEIIVEQLTNGPQKKDTLRHFYDRVLLAGDYNDGVDYQQVDEMHPLVQMNMSEHSPIMANGRKQPNRKKYYIVTGETFKDLLARASTKRGREVRAYYRKVEQLAVFMRDLILEMTRREVAKAQRTIEVQQKSMLRLNQFARDFKKRTTSQYIYIATTAQYSARRHFKVGGSVSETAFRKRFASYMSGRPTTDEFYPVHWRRVSDYHAVEEQIKAIAGDFREKDSKEIYVMRFARLRDIVDFAANNDNQGTAMSNALLDGIVADLEEGEFDDPVAPVQMPNDRAPRLGILEAKEGEPPADPLRDFIRANSETIASPEIKADPAKQSELAIQMMQLLIDGFNFERDKNAELKLVWKTLADTLKTAEKKSNVLKLNEWKAAIKRTVKGTTISFKWR